MRSQAPEAVEKAGLLAETRQMGHPERLFVSTLTPEKSSVGKHTHSPGIVLDIQTRCI